MKYHLFLILFVLFNANAQHIKIDSIQFNIEKPLKTEELKKISLWATRYYIFNAPYSDSGFVMNSADGSSTGVKLNICDWCGAAIEGTLIISDNEGKKVTLNHAKKSEVRQVDCSQCLKYKNYRYKSIEYALWSLAKGKFGDGVNGYQLVPFRTIAVDKSIIPIGSVIYIPDTVGKEIELPDGLKLKHDGYFFAADVGGEIKENHIDIFTGLITSNPFHFIENNKLFIAYIIEDKNIKTMLSELHKGRK